MSISGVLQTLLVALWTSWQANHPERFPQEIHGVEEKISSKLTIFTIDLTKLILCANMFYGGNKKCQFRSEYCQN
jgi:hypothetical protein